MTDGKQPTLVYPATCLGNRQQVSEPCLLTGNCQNMASDTPLQAIGAYLLAIAKAHPQDQDSAHVKLHTDDSKALISLDTCLHEAVESGTPANEEEVSLFIPTNNVEVCRPSMLISS